MCASISTVVYTVVRQYEDKIGKRKVKKVSRNLLQKSQLDAWAE